VRYVGSCAGKGAITLLLLMRDEKAVCSRLEDAHVFASMTRILEGLMLCDLLGLGCGLGIGIRGSDSVYSGSLCSKQSRCDVLFDVVCT
jgi:hypothetical protein